MAQFEPVLTRYVKEPGSYTLDFHVQHGGYEAVRKARVDDARGDHRRGEEVRPARPRRRRLPDRHEVGLRPEGQPQAEVPADQRRRERAGHVQGSRAARAQPAPAVRRLRHRLPGDRRQGLLHLHPRRVLPPAPAARGRDRQGPRRRLPGAEHPRQRPGLRDLRAPRRRGLRGGRRDRAHRVAGREAGAAAHQAAVPGRGRPLRLPDRGQQRRDGLQRAADHRARRRRGSRPSGRRRTPARSCSASAATSSAPAPTRRTWA